MKLRPRDNRRNFSEVKDHNIFCDICTVEYPNGCPGETFLDCENYLNYILSQISIN